jgi:hypothetical protein
MAATRVRIAAIRPVGVLGSSLRAGRLENTYGLGGGGFQIVKQCLLVLVGINLLRDPFDREVGETLFLT